MRKSKMWALLAGVMMVSLVLAACQPQQVEVPVTVVIRETQQVEVEVVQTEQVEVVQTQVVEVTVQAEAFTQPHPILGDLRVRQAIAYCSNRPEMVQTLYPYVEDASTLLMDTFIPTDHWAHADGVTQYPFDPEQGMALLDEAGWTLPAGGNIRQNANGDALSLKFTTTNAALRQTWGAIFVSNMADCGVQIIPLYAPASWWFGDTTGLSRRDFELGAYAWVGQADPGGRTLYACDQIPLPSNNWLGQNYMGWCNEAASAAISRANNTLDRDERIEAYRIVQEEFAKDMVSLPMFNRPEHLATTADLQGFDIAPGQEYSMYNLHEWSIPGSDTIVLGLSQEPASLWPLVESAWVANASFIAIQSVPYKSLNYDYTANMYFKQLPTLENGFATMEAVEVTAGDMVVDADGNPVELANGVMIQNADGEVVEYTGGTAMMNQMTLVFEFEEGITWSDGEPLKAADVELAARIDCDPDTGATTFFTCERTASESFSDASYTRVLLPGTFYPLYFLMYAGWYPSHQVTSDGRTLADVPAAEWATLPEIAEMPLSTGPYMVESWVKGQSISLVANPHFYKGAPATPNVIIQIIQDTNQAVAQLLTGDVDALFAETLIGGPEITTLQEADEAGSVNLYILPSATWEHIDFNLFAP